MRLSGLGLAALYLTVLVVGTAAPVEANCVGYVCESICEQDGQNCGPPHCALSDDGGSCDCETKIRERNGFEIYICRPLGGECSTGCGGGSFPVPFQSEQSQGGERPFPLRQTAEMEAALASYADVLVVLEALRGPVGVPAGEAETMVMLSRALPKELQSDGLQAFEPPTTAAVWFLASGGQLLFETVFEDHGRIVSGEIRRGGDSGVVEIRSPEGTLVDRIAW